MVNKMRFTKVIIFFMFLFMFVTPTFSEEFGYNLLETGKGLNPSTNLSTITVNRSDWWDNLDFPNSTQMEESDSELNIKTSWMTNFIDVGWLKIDGSNANTNIDINGYSFTSGSTGSFAGGIIDSGGFSSVDTESRVLSDGSQGAIDWYNRYLYANDGSDVILDWSTSGSANFADSNIVTSENMSCDYLSGNVINLVNGKIYGNSTTTKGNLTIISNRNNIYGGIGINKEFSSHGGYGESLDMINGLTMQRKSDVSYTYLLSAFNTSDNLLGFVRINPEPTNQFTFANNIKGSDIGFTWKPSGGGDSSMTINATDSSLKLPVGLWVGSAGDGIIGVNTPPNDTNQLYIISQQGGSGNAGIKVIYTTPSILGEFSAVAHRGGQWHSVYARQGTSTNAIRTDGLSTFNGNLHFMTDNNKALFGAGKDSSVSYNGSDMLINPKEVGTGDLVIYGNLRVNGNVNISGCISYNGGSLGTCI